MPSKNGHTPSIASAPVISVEMPGVVKTIPLDLIDPNPWQPRQGEDTDHIQKLVESIAVDGLLQIPTARRVAVVMSGDRFQLAFGHSRLAAYKRLHAQHPDDPRWREFPLNLRNLTDRQMADAAARENVTRKDLSAIEIAGAIQRYITDFGATQLEAGRVYGYTSQSSVSNLLRLLQLPDPVRALVNDGKLPERHVRVNLVLAAALIAGQTSRVAHLQCEATEDGRAIATLTRELAEERIWSSYYQDISDSLAGELQRIDDMLAGVGYEAQGDESIADRVARLIGVHLRGAPAGWVVWSECAEKEG